MYAFCPECETELDQATGICPACRWDPLLNNAQQPAESSKPAASLSERYRGTQFDISSQVVAGGNNGLSRGRTFVIISLVAGLALYGLVLGVTGLI